MERWVRRTIELGAGIAFTGKINPSVVPYYPQKTVVSGEEERYFRRSYPERVGVSSGRILALLVALEKEKRANLHNLIIIRRGEIISECSHPGYSTNIWHLSHSMSKTLTGMAIGMLVDDGKLSTETRLVDIFPNINYKDTRFEKITVAHLLSMQSGVRFSEAGSVTETKWTEAFFESSMAFTPGTDFSYNSMNSYILARIVTEISGKSLTAFLTERLFEPLGITNVFIEKGPEGIEKGGWGVYMSTESWGKVGYMMLSGGVFEGKRILSKEWVERSTSKQADTPGTLGHYDYGYQLWVSRDKESYLFNGMLGQNVWVCPKNDIIAVFNSGNNELFQKSPALLVIEKYLSQPLEHDLVSSCFAGDLVDLRRKEDEFFTSRHWVRPLEAKRGIKYRLGFRQREGYPEAWDELLGYYHFRKNNYGMLPLIVRGMQNNLYSSIDGVGFEREGEALFFTFSECGRAYRLEIGFYDFKETVIDIRGEKYIVKVIGEAMEDEDRDMLFKIELLFPELPNTRMLKFSIEEEGRLLMRMSEVPNNKIADIFLDDMAQTNPKLSLALKLVEKRIGENFTRRKLEQTFAPSLIGARVGAENYTEIMDEEREKVRSQEKNAKLIDTVIEKFIRDEEDFEEDADRYGLKGIIGDIFERIKAKMPQKSEQKVSALPEKTEPKPAELPPGE